MPAHLIVLGVTPLRRHYVFPSLPHYLCLAESCVLRELAERIYKV